MISACLQYIGKLRLQNHRIQELSESIEKFDRHKHYLDNLNSEHDSLAAEYKALSTKWRREYAVSAEYGHIVRNELYIARNQPEKFTAKILDDIRGMSSHQIEAKIVESESIFYQPEKHVLPESVTSDPREDAEETDSLSDTLKDEMNRLEPYDSSFITKRRHTTWSLTDATELAQKLEATLKGIEPLMRSLGPQSCATTVRLRSLETKIQQLKDAMKQPATSLYRPYLIELMPYKIQAYQKYLTPESAMKESPRLHTSYQSTPRSSWVDSLESSMTDLSMVGNEFQKLTEKSLHDVASQWL